MVHPKEKLREFEANVLMVGDYISSSVFGSFSAMKVASVFMGGTGEVTHSPEGNRLYHEDGSMVNLYAIDGKCIQI